MNDLKGTTLSFIGTAVMAEAMIGAIFDKGLRNGGTPPSPVQPGRLIRNPNT